MIALIIYAVMALAVAGTVYAGYEHVIDKGREEIKTLWAPLITKCGKRAPAECAAEWTAAIDANVSLQVDVSKIAADRAVCTKSVDDWSKLADRAATVAEQNRQTAAGALAQLKADRATNAAKGREVATVGETCQQVVDELDKDSREFADKRAILFPSTAAPDRLKVGP